MRRINWRNTLGAFAAAHRSPGVRRFRVLFMVLGGVFAAVHLLSGDPALAVETVSHAVGLYLVLLVGVIVGGSDTDRAIRDWQDRS